MKRSGLEKYAALPGGGFAFAVTIGAGAPQRFHDGRSLDELEELLDATPEPRWLSFSGMGVPVGDGEAAQLSTHAGRVRVSELTALRYWSPLDSALSERAYESAEALLDALVEGVAGLQQAPTPSTASEGAEQEAAAETDGRLRY